MNKLVCEMCGSNEVVKEDGVFVCQFCGTKYSVEEAKRMMIEGTVDVQGTVKVDNTSFVEKYLANARRALSKDDWEEVEKYYNLVEQNTSNNMEAVFFSAYGKAMLSLTDTEYFKRDQKFGVLNKSISVINDYFEETKEDRKEVLYKISEAIEKMFSVTFVYSTGNAGPYQGSFSYTKNTLMKGVRKAFLTELKQIKEAHPDIVYLNDLILKNTEQESSGGCYVATAVYGSYDCPQVWTLRRYRDYSLAKTWYGRAFIHTYYAISPTLVRWFGNTEWFKKMWRGKLDRMVKNLQNQGFESTPYKDIDWK